MKAFIVLIATGLSQCTAFTAPLTPSYVSRAVALQAGIDTIEEAPTDMPSRKKKSDDDVVADADDGKLPPVLQNMVDERRVFELNLGKAMDTLRKDYPKMLTREPNFEIFSDDISVVDPSGVQISGLSNYKSSFRFLQTLIKWFYNSDRSIIQHRMVYDWARSSIRISWNAVLVPKVVGNVRNSLYVDGISIYKMDASSGKIVEHKVEKMMINNIPVRPPYGVFTALKEEMLNPTAGQRVPVGVGAMYRGACLSSSAATE